MAAEKLIGEKLPLFHFRRVRHPRVPNRATHFRSDVQEAIVRRAQERGEELVVARSNLEHLARPFPTFPHWTAVTVGAVVLAEALDIGGIVTGRNISGIYLGWGTRFRSEGEQEESWGRVFASAGLPLIQPLAGASDITSKRIAEDHRLIDLARSCARGTLKGPCLKCKKCVLTEVMQAVIEGSVLPDEYNHSFASTPSLVKRFGSDPPYPNQHLLEYSIARMPHVETTFLANAARHLKPSLQRTSWVERYFRPALDAHVPEHLIPRVSNRIEQHASFMNSHDEDQLRTWSAEVNALGDVE